MKCRKIVDLMLKYSRCGFRPGRRNTEQIFTLRQIFDKHSKYTKDVFAFFVDLKNTYVWVPRDKP